MTRGPKVRQKCMFYSFDPEDYIPQNHPLRLISALIDKMNLWRELVPLYNRYFGRPAVDPEMMFRILFLGYLYGLSENRLFQELRMHLGYRWFCKLEPDEPIPDRSTLNKLRNHRWAQAGVVEKFLRRVVEECIAYGLVRAKYLSVDGSQVVANASINSFEPIEVEQPVEEYLSELDLAGSENSPEGQKLKCQQTPDEEPAVGTAPVDGPAWSENPPKEQKLKTRQSTDQDPPAATAPAGNVLRLRPTRNDAAGRARRRGRRDFRGERLSNKTHRSRTDPDARLYRKGRGKEAKLSYLMHDLVDAESGVILWRQVTEASGTAERRAAVEMLQEARSNWGYLIKEAALSADKAYCTRQFLAEAEALGLIPYVAVASKLKRKEPRRYKRKAPDVAAQQRRLRERREVEAGNRLLDRVGTPEYLKAQRLRTVNERDFAEAKALGMDRARYRGRDKVAQQSWMTAAVQNVRRLLSWLRRHPAAPAARAAIFRLTLDTPGPRRLNFSLPKPFLRVLLALLTLHRRGYAHVRLLSG